MQPIDFLGVLQRLANRVSACEAGLLFDGRVWRAWMVVLTARISAEGSQPEQAIAGLVGGMSAAGLVVASAATGGVS